METCPGKRSINVSKRLLQMEASVSCLSTSSAYVCFLCGRSSHILVVHCKYIRYFYVKCVCFYLLSPFYMAVILPPSVVETNFCLCDEKIEYKNKTYPLSTRKESLQVLLFLLNWNLGGGRGKISGRTTLDICAEQTHAPFSNAIPVQL